MVFLSFFIWLNDIFKKIKDFYIFCYYHMHMFFMLYLKSRRYKYREALSGNNNNQT